MATTTPNFGWSVPTSTDLVKDGATAIELLGDSIDTTLVDLKGGTTGQVLSKTSGTDMDFTWVTTDDANAIQNAIVDAKGDLIGASADNTPARVPIGANGHVLTADSTETLGLKWAAPASGSTFVGCSLYDTNATQSISNNTSTLVTWNSENFDTTAFHSTATNTSRITIPAGKAGYYLFTSYGFFGDNATGNRRLDLRKNGSLIRSWPTPSTTNTFSGLTITCLLSLAEADYIEIAVFQTSGGALSYFKGIDTGNQYGSFECQYLGG